MVHNYCLQSLALVVFICDVLFYSIIMFYSILVVSIDNYNNRILNGSWCGRGRGLCGRGIKVMGVAIAWVTLFIDKNFFFQHISYQKAD